MTNDGLVKFIAEHTMAPAIEAPHWEELNAARTNLFKLGLVGIDSAGVGYGNLSIRLTGGEFLISGTATGALPELTRDQYCLVKSFNFIDNRVVTKGPVQASSESMTHGAVYDACPEANCVIHIHSNGLFGRLILEPEMYPATPKEAGYGTPELAMAIEKCVNEINKNEGVIVLAGHEGGILAYGTSVERALNLILELQKKFGG